MVLVISQQTFDDVVQENINDLGLSPEEAVAEAVEQFKAQGVDLSNIIAEYVSSDHFRSLNEAIAKLKEFNAEKNASKNYVNELILLKQECDKGMQYKVAAGKSGAYDVILDTFVSQNGNKEVEIASLKAMVSLKTKQPDLLDDRGVQVILSHLEPETATEVAKLILRWCKECCVMHEMNRQQLFDANIVDKLAVLLEKANADVMKEVLAVLRALILDDDVRVEFGRAHEHARAIAGVTLPHITGLIHKFKTDETLVNDLMLTLSALLVRAEFCKVVEEVGGLELIHEVMTGFVESDKITRQCFKVLKALAGNDDCKAHIIQKGLAPVISKSLDAHKGSVLTAAAGLSCVAALSLRSPDNSKVLFEADLADVITETMKKHPEQKSVQKTACWAIRNMVSRSRYQNRHFLELGVEELLKNNLDKFREFEYDIKAALRDLECSVDLKEEWTGKGGILNTEAAKRD